MQDVRDMEQDAADFYNRGMQKVSQHTISSYSYCVKEAINDSHILKKPGAINLLKHITENMLANPSLFLETQGCIKNAFKIANV